MITKSYVVKFTRTYTRGQLNGVSFDDELPFPTRRDATSWIKRRLVKAAKPWADVSLSNIRLVTIETENMAS